jgi:hypothetical protein
LTLAQTTSTYRGKFEIGHASNINKANTALSRLREGNQINKQAEKN